MTASYKFQGRESCMHRERRRHADRASDLIGALPEETSRLLQRKVWAQIMDEFLRHGEWSVSCLTQDVKVS